MKVLGILGTLVWDTIWHPAGRGEPVEQWGGIAYSLVAAAAACPPGWTILPIVRAGSDLADQARSFLAALPNGSGDAGLTVVPEANNRVELRYVDDAERTERLTGGVTSWSWSELAPIVARVDALYLNFVSGFELELGTAEELRRLPAPTYADLHSLYLGAPGAGARAPRRLIDWTRWLSAFDAVQLNESELALTGPHRSDPLDLLPELPGLGPALVVATRGGAGASFSHRPGRGHPADWPGSRGPADPAQPVVTGTVSTPAGALAGDPTGCGDIWGAVLFSRLLVAEPVDRAIRTAHAAAATRLTESRVGALPNRIADAIRTQQLAPG